MSDHETRIPWAQAYALACELLALLAGSYVEARVAGSVRRGKADVGDLELVLAPAFDGAINLLDARCNELLTSVLGKRLKAVNGKSVTHAWGSRYKAAEFQRIPVDLFIVLPDRQWGPTFLIRTGPGDANKQLVTSEPYGVLPAGLRFEDGVLWRGSEPLDTPDEIDVFAACGLPWIAPPLRSIALYREIAAYPRAFSRRVRCTSQVDIPLTGWLPREDAVWTPDGTCVFLPAELARPTHQVGEMRPLEQVGMFV